MLIFAVPLIWLAIAMFVVVLCRAAADGDAALIAGGERGTGMSHGIGSPSATTRRTWRRPAVRSAARPGRGAHSRAALDSDLLARRGNE